MVVFIRYQAVLKRILAAALFILILLAVIVPTWRIYMGEGREMIMIDYKSSNNQSHLLSVNASILDVDFAKKTYLIYFVLEPNDALINSQGQLMQDTVLSFSTLQKYSFPAGSHLKSIQVPFHYDDGNPIDYPFDVYTSYFEIEATMNLPTSANTSSTQPIALSFRLDASLTSFSFVPTLTPLERRLGLQVVTGRSTTTLGFSIFMCLLMWALSLVLAVYGYQVLFHHRAVHEHTCMLGITMLFALPALRSAQPGIPDVGCLSDVLGFYWNMAIIALQCITILACWIARWDPAHSHGDKTSSKQSVFHKTDNIKHIEHFASCNAS